MTQPQAQQRSGPTVLTRLPTGASPSPTLLGAVDGVWQVKSAPIVLLLRGRCLLVDALTGGPSVKATSPTNLGDEATHERLSMAPRLQSAPIRFFVCGRWSFLCWVPSGGRLLTVSAPSATKQ